MRKFRFNLVLTFLIVASLSNKVLAVTDDQCMKASFELNVSHKIKPFGLFKQILSISKRGCQIEIEREKYRFIKDVWNIDVCRGPVHIKKGKAPVEVLKRRHRCKEVVGEFCETLDELLAAVQDDGLIFAKGIRTNLKSDHGRVYCIYRLLDAYLTRGIIFGNEHKYKNTIFSENKEKVDEKALTEKFAEKDATESF